MIQTRQELGKTTNDHVHYLSQDKVFFLMPYMQQVFTLWFGVPFPPRKVTEAPYPLSNKLWRPTRRFFQKMLMCYWPLPLELPG